MGPTALAACAARNAAASSSASSFARHWFAFLTKIWIAPQSSSVARSIAVARPPATETCAPSRGEVAIGRILALVHSPHAVQALARLGSTRLRRAPVRGLRLGRLPRVQLLRAQRRDRRAAARRPVAGGGGEPPVRP